MTSRPPTTLRVPVDNVAALDTALEAVREALARMRFGQVQLTVHEGRLVQLDVTERQRFG